MSDRPLLRLTRGMKGAPIMGTLFVLVLSLAVAPLAAGAEVVARKASETDDALMARALGGSAELAPKVVRTTALLNGKVTLIGFVTADDKPLVGHLLIETAADRYRHVEFPSCDVNGDTPRLLAVFFARTVKDGGRDLAVLCSWEANHADVDGTLYGAEFYRLQERGSDIAVEPAKELNARFETADLAGVDKRGRRVVQERAKFKTVAGVKKLLTKMGLPQ